MNCPACGAPNEGASEHCFSCGKTLFALTEGTVVGGRYELRQMIGRGGMGIVYRAFDKALEEEVALKVLRPDVASMADLTRRFRSEIKLARRVRHRNVCGIHEYGQDGPVHFIAMELIQGTDLKRHLQKHGRFPTLEAWDVAIQIAEGLDAIHHAEIVHRDLKAHNIMRDERGVVRVMDFGIAKALGMSGAGGATLTGQIIGTPEYMSPEQARGDQIDSRSDIYALGVVIFELFTGEVPFHGETPIATLFKHIQDPPPIEGQAGIPPRLVPILVKALAKDPAQRYETAHAMAVALREGLRDSRAEEAAAAVDSTVVLPATQRVAASPVTVARPTPAPTRPPLASTQVRPTRGSPPPPPRPAATPRAEPPPPPRPRGLALPLLVAAGLAGVLVLALALFLWVRSRGTAASPSPTIAEQPGDVTASTPPPLAPTPVPTPSAETPGHEVAPPDTTLRTAPTPPPRREVVPSAPPATYAQPTAPSPRAVPTSAPASLPPATLPAATQGTIRIRVLPWADVEVDGERRGTTPLRPLALSAGNHTLRFTHPDYRPLIKRIIVRANETVTVEVDLGREAFPR